MWPLKLYLRNVILPIILFCITYFLFTNWPIIFFYNICLITTYWGWLKGKAYYSGLHLAPAEGFYRGFFCPLGKKRAFHICACFMPFLVFSSNLCDFYIKEYQKNKKSQKKIFLLFKSKSKKKYLCFSILGIRDSTRAL